MTDPKPSDPKANSHQIASPSYRLAALDQDFLLSEDMRGVRFLLEYSKPEIALKAHDVRSTIVVFGGARIHENGTPRETRWYAEARAFGKLASERGGAIGGKPYYNVIATGGGPGAMEAANRGAIDAGALSIGFNIVLPHEQEPNAYTTPDLTFNFHYFAMRKMHLAMRANALVAFPGGFGTFDELFEILTLRQTRKVTHMPIVLFDEAYWRSVINLDKLVEYGVIEPTDLTLFRYADTAEQAWASLIEQGLQTERPAAPQDAPVTPP